MNDLSILKNIKKTTGIDFKLVREIDYRDDMGQYTWDEGIQKITGIKLARRATTVPDGIFNLLHLEVLDLSLAKISEISSEILKLSYLKKLNLYNTDIKRLPQGIKKLHSIENIHLGQTPIVSLPEELCDLHNLQKLTLWGTKLRKLPQNIGNLQNLKRLDLSDCRLETLPESIVKLKIDFTVNDQEHDAIRIVGTELDDKMMLQCAKQGKIALANYLQSDSYKNKHYDFESKLVLLGKGAVGKTCLAHALKNNFFDQAQSRTEGIEVSKITMDLEGRKACVHLWDFGGQELYHPLYTLFMTDATIYVVVLNGRSDDKPDEWLQFINTFAPSSSIIVVINRIDENPRADINREYYLKKFNNIKEIVRCSCKNADLPEGNIEQLRLAITNIIRDDSRYKINWEESWVKVKSVLEEMPDGFSTYSQFIEICKENNITERKEAQELLKKCNQFGIVLTYSSNSIFNPNWLARSFSCLLNLAEKGIQGLCVEKDYIFEEMYKLDCSYEIDQCEFFIQTLANFNLCYPHGNKLFLPGVLNLCLQEKIEEDYGLWYTTIWRYNISPSLIMQRLLTREFNFICGNNAWRNGIMLSIDNTKVLIVQSELEITIYVEDSDSAARCNCLSYIRNCLHGIHTELLITDNDVNEMMVLRAKGAQTLYPLSNLKKLYGMKVNRFAIPELNTFFTTAELLGEASVVKDCDSAHTQEQEAYEIIMNRLDSMEASHIEDQKLIKELCTAIREMYNEQTDHKKNTIINILTKCGAMLLSILGSSADATTLLTYFNIPLNVLLRK